VEKFIKQPAKLVAAFDASGKENSEVIVVAGFISSHADWNSFNTQWLGRLKKDGLEYFHMVDFANFRRQFATGWKDNEERRKRLFGDLLDIIKSHVYRQFASAIEMNTFDQLSAENKKEFSLNAYALAARTCAADVRRWQEKEKFQPPTAYAFEDGDEGKGLMTERFLQDGLAAPVFKGKKGYTPLQAADILAYELHKPHRDLLTGKPRVQKFRFGLDQLSHIPGVPGYYSPKKLQELDKKFTELSDVRGSVDKSAEESEIPTRKQD
jgi:hypothetical protein